MMNDDNNSTHKHTQQYTTHTTQTTVHNTHNSHFGLSRRERGERREERGERRERRGESGRAPSASMDVKHITKLRELGHRNFLEVYPQDVYPCIADDYAALLKTVPTRVEERKEKKANKRRREDTEDDPEEKKKDAVTAKLQSVVEDAKRLGERRNCFLNLSYTSSHENTKLQKNITYSKVANMAVDMFMVTSLPAGEPTSIQAASVDGETVVKMERPSLDNIEALPKFPWNIPDRVERGYEIPICVTEGYNLEVGSFPRMALDVVVNAVWLALSWAKKEGNDEAVSRLKALIVDWPMDFIFIEASSPEELDEKKFTWQVNYCAKIERLREYVGLDSQNLMRIIVYAREIVTQKQAGGKKASPRLVHAWLIEHIKWGVRKCPKRR